MFINVQGKVQGFASPLQSSLFFLFRKFNLDLLFSLWTLPVCTHSFAPLKHETLCHRHGPFYIVVLIGILNTLFCNDHGFSLIDFPAAFFYLSFVLLLLHPKVHYNSCIGIGGHSTIMFNPIVEKSITQRERFRPSFRFSRN